MLDNAQLSLLVYRTFGSLVYFSCTISHSTKLSVMISWLPACIPLSMSSSLFPS